MLNAQKIQSQAVENKRGGSFKSNVLFTGLQFFKSLLVTCMQEICFCVMICCAFLCSLMCGLLVAVCMKCPP